MSEKLFFSPSPSKMAPLELKDDQDDLNESDEESLKRQKKDGEDRQWIQLTALLSYKKLSKVDKKNVIYEYVFRLIRNGLNLYKMIVKCHTVFLFFEPNGLPTFSFYTYLKIGWFLMVNSYSSPLQCGSWSLRWQFCIIHLHFWHNTYFLYEY